MAVYAWSLRNNNMGPAAEVDSGYSVRTTLLRGRCMRPTQGQISDKLEQDIAVITIYVSYGHIQVAHFLHAVFSVFHTPIGMM